MILLKTSEQRKKQIIGLNFIPDRLFRDMFVRLQRTVFNQFAGVFFLNATRKAAKKMKGSFLCSYKLNGWIIPIDKIAEFEQLFYEKKDISDWDEYRRSIWAWNDTEGYHEWLFSFEGPIFGETIIE